MGADVIPGRLPRLLLAPLRGVTIRRFREIFAEAIVGAGFGEAVTPFVPAMAGLDPLKDRELAGGRAAERFPLRVTPQFIGKDASALRKCLERIKSAGYDTADLNCGCPFPMIRNKGRGSGLLRSPDALWRMLDAGCETMGAGKFSVKVRLGVERPDELQALMPILNGYPLRFMTVHGRVARQMYEGEVNEAAVKEVMRVAKVPVVVNGDLPAEPDPGGGARMVGRAFIRSIAVRKDIGELLSRYIDASTEELCGDRPVLGRIKELVAYWKDLPGWSRRWNVVKMARTLSELRIAAVCLAKRTPSTPAYRSDI